MLKLYWNSSAFMLPAVILIMSVMMIVGSVALLQANNVMNIATGIGDLSTARSAARAGSEYAQVTFNNTACWVGTASGNGGNGDVELSLPTDKQKISFEVTPEGSADPCSTSDINVTIIGKVYASHTSASPKKSFRLKTNLNKYSAIGSNLVLSGGGGNRGLSGAVRAQVAGKDLLFGIYGNVDRGNHFLCIDLSKTDGPSQNDRTCDGQLGPISTESTYIPSDGSSQLGQGDNQLMSLGAGGNISSVPFYDTSPGQSGVFRRYYFGAHHMGTDSGVGDDRMGYVCVEVTSTGVVRPCSNSSGIVTFDSAYKTLEIGPSAAPTAATSEPNQMFDGPIEYNKKLYALGAVAKSGNGNKKVYCWNINTNSLCSAQPYPSNLPNFDPVQHHYAKDDRFRYGMYSTSAKDSSAGKVYWTVNYSTFVNVFDTWVPWGGSAFGGPTCWDLLGCMRQPPQRWFGTRVECFDMITNAPCFTPSAGSNILDGDTALTNSNYGSHSYVYQPFFRKTSIGLPTSICASVSANPLYIKLILIPWEPYYFPVEDIINQRQQLKCYTLSDGTEDNSAETANLRNGLENGLHLAYNNGISYDASGKFGVSGVRTYFTYTAFNHLMSVLDLNPPMQNGNLPQLKRDRSIGICWDWSKPNGGGRCDGWTTNKTWPNVTPSGDMNTNLMVTGFTADDKCLIAISAADSNAGLFGVNPSNGEANCDPIIPKKVF